MKEEAQKQKLNSVIKETLDDISKFAEALMNEHLDGRLSSKEYEVGFNLKTCILLYYGRKD